MRLTSSASSHNFLAGISSSAIFIFIVIAVGFRGELVGTDTENYIEIFHQLKSGEQLRFELAFTWFTKGIGLLTHSTGLYFTIICAMVLINYNLILYFIISDNSKARGVHTLLLLGLLMGSSWFFVAVTNGIRQGISLTFAYLSILFLTRSRHSISFILMLVSIGFHLSSIFLIPFVLLLFIKRELFSIVICISAAAYPFGVFELILEKIDVIFNIPIWFFISSYGAGIDYREGFQFDLYIYSIFWLVVFVMVGRYIDKKFIENWWVVVRIYAICLMPYFVFGFGGFSNRYGYMGWFFLPACQAAFIILSNISLGVKVGIGFIWFFVGLFYFLSLFIV